MKNKQEGNFGRLYQKQLSVIRIATAFLVVAAMLFANFPLFTAVQGQQTSILMAGSVSTSSSSNSNTISTTNSRNIAANASGSSSTTALPNTKQVEFAVNIEEIRGHLEQAIINKQSGNNTLAQAHVLHPIAEIFSKVQGIIAERNSTLNQTLSERLDSLSSSVTSSTLPEFMQQTAGIDKILNDTIQTVVTSEELKQDVRFNASVVARLLDTSKEEYAEGVRNGTVTSIVEYQDAQGFISRAESIFNATDQGKAVDKVKQINQHFLSLNKAVENKDNPEAMVNIVDGIIHELSELTSLQESTLIGKEDGMTTAAVGNQSSQAIINNIHSLLTQLISAYKIQNYTGAENAAVEAYLDNFESLEGPIATHDQQLMVQTELLLREQLRQAVQNKAPIEQVQQLVDQINANLDRAAALLMQK
jgi:hypothetical protein